MLLQFNELFTYWKDLNGKLLYTVFIICVYPIHYRLRLPCLDIADRYRHIIMMYVKDLEFIQRVYNKNKENPPIPRDLPPIAGKIAWIRQLYRHISGPIQVFEQFSDLMKCNEARKAIKGYNKMARVLVEYEVLHHQAWVKQVRLVHIHMYIHVRINHTVSFSQVDAAKVGLRATLLVRNNGKYLVNLDPLILCFLREAECLGRMGLELPPEAIELQFMRSKIRANYDSLTVSYTQYYLCMYIYTVYSV